MEQATEFIRFLTNATTAFQATSELEKRLIDRGFSKLIEQESWSLKSGGKYYLVKSDSAIVAFKLAKNNFESSGFKMVGAHTDSPSLKIKPNSEVYFKNFLQFSVEPYGGMILPTWFDRDLSLAGRVSYQNKNSEIKTALIDFKRPIAIIPSVAIHLDRTQNEGRTVNKQKDLPPVVMQFKDGTKKTLNDLVIAQLHKEGVSDVQKVLAHDLFLYDFQAPTYVGFEEQFIAGGRIDNLLSCFVGLEALSNATNNEQNLLLICNDHEECGSSSTTGASGVFLKNTLERICKSSENLIISMSKSCMISADNAHAIHPNFAEKHEPGHGPMLNGGPVLKINANQRYATSSNGAAAFISSCTQAEVPVQHFVARSDLGCGSTIGPITATLLGVETIDIGAPTFGMHSIRELCGRDDVGHMIKAITSFMNRK